jgi:hypothetical protein
VARVVKVRRVLMQLYCVLPTFWQGMSVKYTNKKPWHCTQYDQHMHIQCTTTVAEYRPAVRAPPLLSAKPAAKKPPTHKPNRLQKLSPLKYLYPLSWSSNPQDNAQYRGLSALHFSIQIGDQESHLLRTDEMLGYMLDFIYKHYLLFLYTTS